MKIVKLLWIDDMESWSSIVQENLAIVAPKFKVDLRIIPSKNGEDADIIKKLEQYDLDAVIMDYHMEPFNGDKYIHDIRNEEHLEHIPIVFYSQDNSTNLSKLVEGLKNITTVYRPNLEDKIKELFF